MIRALVTEGTTVLLTTQYLDEAGRLASEIAVIDHGRVIATGTAAELKAKIGRQTLDVRPADPADLTRVAASRTRPSMIFIWIPNDLRYQPPDSLPANPPFSSPPARPYLRRADGSASSVPPPVRP